MFTKKEIAWIIVMIIIFAFIIEFSNSPSKEESFIKKHPGFIYSPVIISVWVLGKKLVSRIYSIKVEHTCFTAQRFWYTQRSKFKKPFPIGLLVPFTLAAISLGYIKIPLLLQTDIENLPKRRVLKRRGDYKKSEVNESDIGFTIAFGFCFLIILSILALILKQPGLAKYCVIYGIWNLIPFGQTDGCKLFFGSFPSWILLVIVYIIAAIIVLV